ncbi:hypothetical protein HDU97_000269 [Phlyctochytrium planicorne]|nr:hypothetical protein HDU97_000269 [Phlyctochytrium planicorne]
MILCTELVSSGLALDANPKTMLALYATGNGHSFFDPNSVQSLLASMRYVRNASLDTEINAGNHFRTTLDEDMTEFYCSLCLETFFDENIVEAMAARLVSSNAIESLHILAEGLVSNARHRKDADELISALLVSHFFDISKVEGVLFGMIRLGPSWPPGWKEGKTSINQSISSTEAAHSALPPSLHSALAICDRPTMLTATAALPPPAPSSSDSSTTSKQQQHRILFQQQQQQLHAAAAPSAAPPSSATADSPTTRGNSPSHQQQDAKHSPLTATASCQLHQQQQEDTPAMTTSAIAAPAVQAQSPLTPPLAPIKTSTTLPPLVVANNSSSTNSADALTTPSPSKQTSPKASFFLPSNTARFFKSMDRQISFQEPANAHRVRIITCTDPACRHLREPCGCIIPICYIRAVLQSSDVTPPASAPASAPVSPTREFKHPVRNVGAEGPATAASATSASTDKDVDMPAAACAAEPATPTNASATAMDVDGNAIKPPVSPTQQQQQPSPPHAPRLPTRRLAVPLDDASFSHRRFASSAASFGAAGAPARFDMKGCIYERLERRKRTASVPAFAGGRWVAAANGNADASPVQMPKVIKAEELEEQQRKDGMDVDGPIPVPAFPVFRSTSQQPMTVLPPPVPSPLAKPGFLHPGDAAAAVGSPRARQPRMRYNSCFQLGGGGIRVPVAFPVPAPQAQVRHMHPLQAPRISVSPDRDNEEERTSSSSGKPSSLVGGGSNGVTWSAPTSPILGAGKVRHGGVMSTVGIAGGHGSHGGRVPGCTCDLGRLRMRRQRFATAGGAAGLPPLAPVSNGGESGGRVPRVRSVSMQMPVAGPLMPAVFPSASLPPFAFSPFAGRMQQPPLGPVHHHHHHHYSASAGGMHHLAGHRFAPYASHGGGRWEHVPAGGSVPSFVRAREGRGEEREESGEEEQVEVKVEVEDVGEGARSGRRRTRSAFASFGEVGGGEVRREGDGEEGEMEEGGVRKRKKKEDDVSDASIALMLMKNSAA